jgi:hypothetical protein
LTSVRIYAYIFFIFMFFFSSYLDPFIEWVMSTFGVSRIQVHNTELISRKCNIQKWFKDQKTKWRQVPIMAKSFKSFQTKPKKKTYKLLRTRRSFIWFVLHERSKFSSDLYSIKINRKQEEKEKEKSLLLQNYGVSAFRQQQKWREKRGWWGEWLNRRHIAETVWIIKIAGILIVLIQRNRYQKAKDSNLIDQLILNVIPISSFVYI